MSVRKTNESLESSTSCRTCVNHADRLASHQLVSSSAHPDMFYCEKCSIMLASQGFSVVKLNPGTRRPANPTTRNQRAKNQQAKICNRKNEIDSFLRTLKDTMSFLEESDQGIHEHLMESQSQYGNAIEKANAFYREIQEIIELQKYTTYNAILNRRADQEFEARELKATLQECMAEVSSIMDDIRENMDAVETVEYAIYAEIMKGYKVKLDAICEVGGLDARTKPLTKCQIILPEIPSSLYSIADKIGLNLSKSGSGTGFNSLSNIFHPEKIVAEEEEGSCFSSSKNSVRKVEYLKENNQDEGNSFNIVSDQILKRVGNTHELAFSFEESVDQSKEFRPTPQISNQPSFKSIGNSKLSMGSRHSLGAYLDMSSSQGRHYIEDTDTLLIL